MDTVSLEEITLYCQDSTPLAATLFRPATPSRAGVLIGPATGIKRQFYQHFATFLAQQGYTVLTFDNRGIGGSLLGQVRDSQASLQCWGEQDMPAALDYLRQACPNSQYHLVGHSAGGQLVGLMHNAHHLRSIFNYACSSGQLRNMKASYLLKAHFFMNCFIPVSNLLFGHTKSQWVGMGEPLPKMVARQWQQWCNGAGYVKTAFGKTIFNHHYDSLSIPSLWVNAIDDDIANDANVADMISVFPKLEAETLTLLPAEHDLDEIGHMKFFSRKASHLWRHATDWLARQETSQQAS